MQKIYNYNFGTGKEYINVLIPWMGEPQLEKSIYQLKLFAEIYKKKLKITVLFGFENEDVHKNIYQKINTINTVAIKLDGDMIIEDLSLFKEILDTVKDNSIIIAPVYCCIVKKKIYGIHIFGKKVVDLKAGNKLFPDQYNHRNIIKFDLSDKTFVSHCKNPNIKQINEFLGHRLRKLIYSNFTRLDYIPLIIRGFFINKKFIFNLKIILKIAKSDRYKSLNFFNNKEIETLSSSLENWLKS